LQATEAEQPVRIPRGSTKLSIAQWNGAFLLPGPTKKKTPLSLWHSTTLSMRPHFSPFSSSEWITDGVRKRGRV